MTYAADKQIDARWTVPADIRGSSLEEFWLACAHADNAEARRLLRHEQRRDPSQTADDLHKIFFACSGALDGDAMKAEVADALTNNRIADTDLPELLVPLLTTMRSQALDTLEALVCTDFGTRALSPLLVILRAIRTQNFATAKGLYCDYARKEVHSGRSSLIFFRALEFGMPELATLYLCNFNFHRRDFLPEKLIAACHHGHATLVRTLLDAHFDHEPVTCVAVRAALGNKHDECARIVLLDKHYVPRADLGDLAGFEENAKFREFQRLLKLKRTPLPAPPPPSFIAEFE